MGWFSRKKTTEQPPESPPQEEKWIQCSSCKAHIFKEEWVKNFKVCPRCDFHERLTWDERVDMLMDPGTYAEINSKITFADPLQFKDAKGSYAEKAKQTVAKTGMKEAVVTGHGKINGIRVVLAVMDFQFLGGSLGSGTGERIFQAARYATKHGLPYIVVSASGGARMHEGIVSLMQMAKTCAGIAELNRERVPYISILSDPTTGGVSASFAMVGDINIAEPKALVAFAGRRVIEQTIKQTLPDDFQTAEYVLNHGFIDLVVTRKDLKETLYHILQYCVGQKVTEN